MSDEAKKSRVRRLSDYISPVWFVPIIAALIGVWMLIHSFSERGPLITLTIGNADGIEAGTKIRARNVVMGQVQSIELSDDASQAVIKARMNPDAEHLLGNKALFWVVKPRIGRDGISGLSTVLSGAYIEMQPDTQNAYDKSDFAVMDTPPVAPADAAGLHIHLNSTNGSSLSVGDPVVFRGYTVGRIEASNFDVNDRLVHYDVYIFKPYISMVTSNTHFWATSGVNFAISAEGVNLQLGSLETLVSGGVTFDVTEGVDPGPQAKNGDTYTLFPTQDIAEQGSYSQYLSYVLLVGDSIRGLSPGAPVEYRGVRIGTVVAMPWHLDKLAQGSNNGFRIPVLIHIEPQRIQSVVTEKELQKWHQMMARWSERGMRASLATANLVTGALYVDLDFLTGKEAAQTKAVMPSFNGVEVFPTAQAGFGQITGKISALLDKVNALNLNSTVNGLNQNLNNSNKLLVQLQSTSQSINDLLQDPSTRSLSSDIRATLNSLNHSLEGFNPQAPAYEDLRATIQQLQTLLRNIQPAARAISSKPNSLIFNRSDSGDPQPRANK